jgi:gliding motility-associated protein GldC
MAHHNSEIKFNIGLDENKVPESIEWSASDGGINHAASKAMLLSVWDKKQGDTLKIDLWTKEMLADEMKRLVHQTLLGLSDTLERATDDKAAANEIRQFAQKLGEKMELFEK